MRDYQVRGLNWMISLYENGINGILADEMVCNWLFLKKIASPSIFFEDPHGFKFTFTPPPQFCSIFGVQHEIPTIFTLTTQISIDILNRGLQFFFSGAMSILFWNLLIF